MNDIPDFSKPRIKVTFRIDDDVFEAPPVIPAMVLMEYASKFDELDEKSSPEDQMAAMAGILELVLYPVSFERFMFRLSDRDTAIDLDQLQQVIQYLLEKYGMRPTQTPSVSSDGRPNPGAGMSLTESMPAGV